MTLFYPFSWHSSESNIEVYGWTQKGSDAAPETARLCIEGFKCYIFVKLRRNWTDLFTRRMKRAISDLARAPVQDWESRGVFTSPLKKPDNYVFVSFSTLAERKIFAGKLRRSGVLIEQRAYKLECFEDAASPVLQLTCHADIATTDWFTFTSAPLLEDEKIDCAHNFRTHWKSLRRVDESLSARLGIPQPVVFSYDIECHSHDPAVFCDENHPDDKIIQISAVVGQLNAPESARRRILLTLENPLLEIEGSARIEVRRFSNELQMLLGYRDLIRETNPQLMIGYNIFGFDNKYLFARAKMYHIMGDFVRQGCTGTKAEVRDNGWESSAYGRQEIRYLDTFGRVNIDVFTLIRREYRFDNYKLETMARHFLGKGKFALSPYDMNVFYLEALKSPGAPSRHLGAVGYYCVQDSELVFDLFEKLKFWYSLTSMAKICQVPMVDLFTRGQGIKIFSQVYKFCSENDIVVEHKYGARDLEDPIQGAHVLDALPGLYENVVSFDFASLYPSIMRALNIDYSTLVEDDDPIEDEKCHVIEWEEHFGCACPNAKPAKKRNAEKIVVCKSFRFRWLKEPAGILPTILTRLMDERTQVRALMKKLDKNSTQYMIYDKMQLALKVSANSMYGTLATTIGYLPFPAGGMCITAFGRESIHKLVDILESEYNARVVYGDTDSAHVIFPHIGALKIDKHCARVAEELTTRFPSPMRLEFEKVYQHYCLLSKKRYFSLRGAAQDPRDMELDNKGILLKRRDNPEIIRRIYTDILYALIARETPDAIFRHVHSNLAILVSGCPNIESFSLTSSVKVIDSFPIRPRSEKKMYFGTYIVSCISEDPVKRAGQFKRKKVTTEEDFYRASLPRQVQLALRMIARGQPVQNGARLSFVYTTRGGRSASATEKMEDSEYVKQLDRKGVIDTMYYVQLLVKPLSELLDVCLTGNYYETYLSGVSNSLFKYANVLDELRAVNLKRVKFEWSL